jgi:hypothetical protein
MAASKTHLANLALSHLGHSTSIADLATEQSKEARACRDFYDVARDALLRSFPWRFATTTGALALVSTFTADGSEWGYSYRYPSDALRFWRVLNGASGLASRVRSQNADVRFRIGRDATGRLIYSDLTPAVGEWTIRVDDPTRYTADFDLAFSFHLAWLLAPRITTGDPGKLGQMALQNYAYAVGVAKANDANEDGPDLPADAEWITAR